MRQIFRTVLICLIALAIAQSFAQAQIWIMSPANQGGGGARHSGGACNGTIDLSSGCAQPMLGGIG